MLTARRKVNSKSNSLGPRTALALLLVCWAMVGWNVLGASVTHADNEEMIGEEHTMNFSANQTLQLVEEVLRGDGILFDVRPDNAIQTLWKPADNKVSFFTSLAGYKAQYRYEIVVLPQGSNRSKVLVNVRTESVPVADLSSYLATRRINLFQKLDRLADSLPPPAKTPAEGGVNFSLLPNETLQELAKRVTGDGANWKPIAAANGLKSITDVTPFQTIWVPNSLLKNKGIGAAP